MKRLIGGTLSAVFLLNLAVLAVIGCWVLPYVIETWAVFFGHPTFVAWHVGLIIASVMAMLTAGKSSGCIVILGVLTWLLVTFAVIPGL